MFLSCLTREDVTSDLGIDRYVTYFTTRSVKHAPPDLATLAPAAKPTADMS